MKILLTGGAGYIGSHCAVVLAQAGFTPVIFDNFANSEPAVVERLNRLLGNTLAMVKGDVRDTDLLRDTLKKYAIDAVIHLAGLKSVNDSMQDPLEYYSVNVAGSVSLMQAMQKCQIQQLIFSSSATVYGEPEYLPYDENHPTKPINVYGQTKLCVEQILQALSESNPNWSIVNLRYFNPVGAHESGLIGEHPRGTPNNLMPYLLQVAAQKLPQLNIFGNDYATRDGTGERDYIHVMDLARGHLAALSFLISRTGYDVFNLGTGLATTVLELIQSFERINKLTIPYQVTARRPGDLPSYYATPAKAQTVLNWRAQESIDTICASAWHWQRFHDQLSLQALSP